MQRATRDKGDLIKLQEFETKQYESFSLTSLTAYCVFWLNHLGIATSLENLAVASHRMFPSKFCLVGWPQFPDITRTNRSVLQMRPKYRNLATSNSRKGVFLNENGIKEAESVTAKLGTPMFEGEVKQEVPRVTAERGRGGLARSILPQDLIDIVRKSEAYGLYSEGRFDEVEAIHLISLLGIYDHTPSSEKKKKLKAFLDAAKELDDEKVLKFLAALGERFQRYLNK